MTSVPTGQKRKSAPIQLQPSAVEAFQAAKQALASAVLLNHLDSTAPISLMTDASSVAIGGTLQQTVQGVTQPLEFFAQKLSPAQCRYSTFSRELLAIYAAIKHFRHLLEGRNFTVFTDHKPLTFALKTNPDRHSPRELRQLDFVSQYTTDIQYVPGPENPVADALSRLEVESISTTAPLDFEAMARAQETDADVQRLRQSTSNLVLEKRPLLSSPGEIWCDTSTGFARPVVPQPMRKAVFEAIHNQSHPGAKATSKLLTARYVWPNVRKDVRQWCKVCMECQRSKITRHNKAPVGTFANPDARFDHVHIDLVGPLPTCQGFTYLLTMVDRFSRWPEAVPITDLSAETVARAFVARWVATFGVPAIVTTDRGSQFESALFQSLTNLLGTTRTRTTAYHPATNGMVERMHRTLKTALRAQPNPQNWVDCLPLVLLGMRAAIKEDIGFSATEMVYGSTFRLPGERSPMDQPSTDEGTGYVRELNKAMKSLRRENPRNSHPLSRV